MAASLPEENGKKTDYLPAQFMTALSQNVTFRMAEYRKILVVVNQ